MFDQDLLERLPSDPEDAFAIFESEIRKNIPAKKEFMNQEEQESYDFDRAVYTKDYVLALAAFAEIHNFDVGVNFTELMELDRYDFINAFEIASSKIKFFSNKCAFKYSQRMKSGSTTIYVLEESSKAVIHKYINKIRDIISKADLTPLKQEALVTRLNVFALEVDRDRSRLEALISFYVAAKKEVKDIADISESIEKIIKAVSSGKELWETIAPMKIKGLLTEPPKKIEDQSNPSENFDLDDEIPF